MSYFLFLKLLRSFEINRYISEIEEKLFYKTAKAIIFLRFLRNFGVIAFTTHFAASAWLLLQKNHPEEASVVDPNNYR